MLPPEVPRAQILEGVVSGDATDYLLMVSSPNSTAGQALQCRSRDGTITRGRPIPVKWQLRYRDGVRWTEWLDPQSERSGVDTPGASCFHLTGHQAAYDVQLRCEVEPQPMQLCGAYVGSVRIDVRPVTGTELPAYSGPSREGGGEATCR
jgi:hypothetical protein